MAAKVSKISNAPANRFRFKTGYFSKISNFSGNSKSQQIEGRE